MFRAEILWLENGPTLKMEGRLVGEWAEQARCLFVTDVVPKGLIVDLTQLSYVDSAGERLLSWPGQVGAVFVASGIYPTALCERLCLSLVQRIPARHGSKGVKFSIPHSITVAGGLGRHHEEEK